MLFRVIWGQLWFIWDKRVHYGSLMDEYNSVELSGGYFKLNETQLRTVGLSRDQ